MFDALFFKDGSRDAWNGCPCHVWENLVIFPSLPGIAVPLESYIIIMMGTIAALIRYFKKILGLSYGDGGTTCTFVWFSDYRFGNSPRSGRFCRKTVFQGVVRPAHYFQHPEHTLIHLKIHEHKSLHHFLIPPLLRIRARVPAGDLSL